MSEEKPKIPLNTYVAKSPYGLGVFAANDIGPGEVIERCPILIFDDSQSLSPDNHSYDWGNGSWCINLGHGSLYNHSFHPNATYIRDYQTNHMLYVSLSHIEAHEEILVNYNGDIYSQDPLWFHEEKTSDKSASPASLTDQDTPSTSDQ